MFLSAEFRDPHSTAAAIAALNGQGFDKRAMDVFSTRPVEFERGVLDRPSRMSMVAVAGGIVNAVLATSFMLWTQRDYPLVTGGMPLTSTWAVGVIIFEMAMGGAIAGTIAAFLWESGLLSGRRKDPVPPLRDEVIYLRLRCEEPQVSRVRETLAQAGAIEVKPLEAQA